ncbi:MAG: VWA domain-containing protein, partial [Rhodobacterales bacterium]
ARGRAGDRVALIVFGSDADYAAPFSFDTEAIARRIESAEIGISGRATNISDGLGLALKRLETSEAKSKVVILLSDGISNAGATNPRGVAGLAADLGVRVHTIALGPKDLSDSDPGENGVVDAATLRAVSELSGGTSFRVRTSEDLMAVADALDQLEATEGDGLSAEVFAEFWIWPAALAAALCLWIAWRAE